MKTYPLSSWRFKELPPHFSSNGYCLASSLANGINIREGKQVLQGNQVDDALKIGPFHVSNDAGARIALTRLRKQLHIDARLYRERGNLQKSLKNANAEHPYILSVNSSEWGKALSGQDVSNGPLQRIKRLFTSDHVVLVYDHTESTTGPRNVVFDVRIDKAVEVPRSMLEDIGSEIFKISR